MCLTLKLVQPPGSLTGDNPPMSTLQPIVATRLYRMISQQIAARIRAGDFAPQSRLPSERELAASLQVSRTSVREALIALELEGYVEVRVGSGVYVTYDPTQRNGGAEQPEHHARAPGAGRVTMSPDDGNEAAGQMASILAPSFSGRDMTPFELIEVHLLLEPESASLAALNATGAQRKMILDAACGLQAAESPALHNIIFHVAIADASGNTAMATTIRNVWQLRGESALYSKLEDHFVPRNIWQIAEQEHLDVAHAIMQGDRAAARKAMRAHFLEIRGRLRQDFGKPVGD